MLPPPSAPVCVTSEGVTRVATECQNQKGILADLRAVLSQGLRNIRKSWFPTAFSTLLFLLLTTQVHSPDAQPSCLPEGLKSHYKLKLGVL